MDETRELKTLLDAARKDLEDFLATVVKGTTKINEDEVANRISAKNRMYEMRASDYQLAMHEAAERRNAEEAARNRDDKVSADRRAHMLNVCLLLCAGVGAFATGVQAWKAVWPSPGSGVPSASSGVAPTTSR